MKEKYNGLITLGVVLGSLAIFWCILLTITAFMTNDEINDLKEGRLPICEFDESVVEYDLIDYYNLTCPKMKDLITMGISFEKPKKVTKKERIIDICAGSNTFSSRQTISWNINRMKDYYIEECT